MEETDKAQIVNYNMQEWLCALHAKNMGRMLALFADDAIFLPTFSDKIHIGKSGAREYFEKFFLKSPAGAILHDKNNFLDNEGLIYTHGGIYQFIVSVDKKRNLIKARFLMTWRRNPKNDAWEIKSFFSGELPEPEENNE